MTRPTAKPSDHRVMFDADVAEFFGISVKTLQRRVAHPAKGEIDPNDAHPVIIGGRRLWLREDVERLVSIGNNADNFNVEHRGCGAAAKTTNTKPKGRKP
jgi:hypothetical protein